MQFFDFSGPRKKWAQRGPNGGRRIFPTNPDLADILGRTDFDFENFYFFLFFGSQIFGLGPTWAHPLGPGLGPLHPGLDLCTHEDDKDMEDDENKKLPRRQRIQVK